ncbi:hypothetical protein N7505_008699 [Penicillium chrysogenum]|uniref:Uncharacterized protein n=1 Tax=Penicillium chrysogenum TaxID=5076 RepID=A0ABQ8WAQ7_PENCH|nr:hypothetical protein N7505_008699 [Penicillium chrysogenum]
MENKKAKKQKTYNSEDSLVVTHPTTNSPACGLSTAERTGSPIFHTLWSEDSLVVTHPTTNSPACGLSTAERTGSPVLHTLWSYVVRYEQKRNRTSQIGINWCG